MRLIDQNLEGQPTSGPRAATKPDPVAFRTLPTFLLTARARLGRIMTSAGYSGSARDQTCLGVLRRTIITLRIDAGFQEQRAFHDERFETVAASLDVVEKIGPHAR